MAETKNPNQSVGRLLNFESANYNEKITSFKRRIEEQIEVIKLGIKQGDVNDPVIAERYIKKTKRFLQTPLFTDISYMNHKVQKLKNDLKVLVYQFKEISAILAERISSKRWNKILLANKFTYASGKYADFYFPYEFQKFYESDLDYLYGIRPKFESQRILINRLRGLLADKDFLKSIGCKSSWKVSTFKDALSEWVKDFSLLAEAELEEIFELPFFKKKQYLTRDVASFKEIVNVHSQALENITNWIDEQINEDLAQTKDVSSNTMKYASKGITDMYKVYNDFIGRLTNSKKNIDEQYSLYRFGQGVIEADIFDAVFK
ncbi:MAG: hypothetical protein IKI57_05055 [Clostridia bacterium]|nr:hypothetical protein [Clostridia bacterium]